MRWARLTSKSNITRKFSSRKNFKDSEVAKILSLTEKWWCVDEEIFYIYTSTIKVGIKHIFVSSGDGNFVRKCVDEKTFKFIYLRIYMTPG